MCTFARGQEPSLPKPCHSPASVRPPTLLTRHPSGAIPASPEKCGEEVLSADGSLASTALPQASPARISARVPLPLPRLPGSKPDPSQILSLAFFPACLAPTPNQATGVAQGSGSWPGPRPWLPGPPPASVSIYSTQRKWFDPANPEFPPLSHGDFFKKWHDR